MIIMEQEMMSMISCAKLSINQESSDSNCCSIYTSHHPCKRSRIERFKGVVPQQNGHWGAQIYANHHRIWLGTFKSEADAAMAYDSAAIKLRTGDYHRNFPSNNITILEPKFQSQFTTDAVLNMIRDGSYQSKFADFLKSQQGENEIGLNLSSIHGDGEFSCTLLFQKELTPSDVGKLNRLVIPKRYAVKHFPNVPDPSEFDERVEEVQLEFYDRGMSLWKFRYCYWKSSQSFVFTRGWNRFVKEKGLRANDTIGFYMYESRDVRRLGHSFLVIDVASKSRDPTNDGVKEEKVGDDEDDDDDDDDDDEDDHKGFVEMLGSVPSNDTKPGFRLFGVQID